MGRGHRWGRGSDAEFGQAPAQPLRDALRDELASLRKQLSALEARLEDPADGE